jgi:hypothetical protein
MITIYLVEGISLFFRAMQYFQHLLVLSLEFHLYWVQNNLSKASITISVS